MSHWRKGGIPDTSRRSHPCGPPGFPGLDPAHPALLHAGPEFDVGTASGHVGGDRDRSGTPGIGHDLGLALVLLGVQHFVLETSSLEHACECLRDLHARRPDQDR